MDTLLFSERSIWTMLHGMALGGGALRGLFGALFSVRAMRTADEAGALAEQQARYLAWLTVLVAILLWLTVAGAIGWDVRHVRGFFQGTKWVDPPIWWQLAFGVALLAVAAFLARRVPYPPRPHSRT